jgi:hypothetical protein
METLALVTSLVALAISLVALYLASLRPAEISVSAVEDMSRPVVGGYWQGARPPTSFAIALYLWNTGPEGAVLQGIGAFDLKPDGPWNAIEPGPLCERLDGGEITLPTPLKAGDVETAYLQAQLHYRHSPDEMEAFARSLRGFDTITFNIQWSYLRTSRFRHREEPKTKTRSVTVNCGLWKQEF